MGKIKSLEVKKLPNFLTTNDLMEMGLYSTYDAVYLARVRGVSPGYIKFGRKVLYPRESVIDFIESHHRSGSVPLQKSEVGDEAHVEAKILPA